MPAATDSLVASRWSARGARRMATALALAGGMGVAGMAQAAWPATGPLLDVAPGSPQLTVVALAPGGTPGEARQWPDPTAPAAAVMAATMATGLPPATAVPPSVHAAAPNTAASWAEPVAVPSAADADAGSGTGTQISAAISGGGRLPATTTGGVGDSPSAYPVLAMLVGASLVLAGWRRARRR